MTIESIEIRARVSLGDFCFTQCKAYCCRKGYVTFTPEEYALIFKILDKDKPKEKLTVSLMDSCPALGTDFKCSIRSNSLHPKICGEYPIFIRGKKVIMAGDCLAVKEDKFYPFVSEWLREGYEIIISSGGESFSLKQ